MPSAIEREHPKTGEATSSGLVNVLQIACKRRFIVILGVVIGLVVGAIAFAQKPPVYQSNAQIIVIKKQGNPLGGHEIDPRQSFYEDYVATHSVVIKSPVVVANAVKSRHLDQLPSMEGVENVTNAIRNSLSVQRDTKDPTAPTNVLNLSCRGTKSQDCAVILDAVIDSYKEFLDETYRNVSNSALTEISRAAIDLQKNLDEKVKGYEEFQSNAPLLSAKGVDGRGIQEIWLNQLYTLRLSQLVRRSELQARIEALETAIKEGRGRQVLMVQLTATANRAGSMYQAAAEGTSAGGRTPAPAGAERKADEQLFDLLLKEQALLAEYGPKHPDVLALQKRMELTREFFKSDKLGYEKGRDPGILDPVQWHLQAMNQELADTEVSIKALTRLAEVEQGEVRDTIKYRAQDRRHHEDIERAQKLFEPIIHRLEEIKLVRDLGGFDARLLAPPEKGFHVGPVALNYFILASFFGLLSGLGMAYVADMQDKSFRNPEDIRRHLGLPVIGHIPLLKPELATDGCAFDPLLCAHYQPKSTQAESFRGVRTVLYFSVQGEVHKVIQITSPNPSDGKSTLAANLAICIAQSGKRVILIDGDMRKPKQHKMFGLAPTIGLSTVIADQAELKDATLETPVAGLWLLPCGPRPDNPAELLTSPRLKELIAVLRDQYDFVLIDTPPLLAVTDPCVVAPRVDGVLLAVRVSGKGRPAAQRAREILSTLDVNVLGVVVNGAGGRALNYGGYDPYYTTTYQYSYQYAYDSSYHDEPGTAGQANGNGSAAPPSAHRLPPPLLKRLMFWRGK